MDPSLPFPLLGLTGSIASGKTHVARILQARGWVVLDADKAAREVVEPGTEGLRAVLEVFGDQLQLGDGTLDRRILGELIFKSSEARKDLEALLHPLIEIHLHKHLQALPPSTKGAVLDAALWVERGQAHHFDAFWLVEAPEALRLERLMKRDSLQEATARQRMQSQSAFPEKALHADHIILNDGRALESQVMKAEDRLLADWRSLRVARWSIAMDCPFSSSQLREILEALLSRGGDYGELFVELRRSQALGMDDGRMEDVLASETFGASLRLLDGETTRFADLIAPSLEELLQAARTLSAPGNGNAVNIPDLVEVRLPTPSPVERVPSEVPLSEKVALVRRA